MTALYMAGAQQSFSGICAAPLKDFEMQIRSQAYRIRGVAFCLVRTPCSTIPL